MDKVTKSFDEHLKKMLKNKAVRQAYEDEGVYVELAAQIIRARLKKKISQKELARRLHTSQQMMSRLEDVRNRSFSLRTLVKLARAMNMEVKIELVDGRTDYRKYLEKKYLGP